MKPKVSVIIPVYNTAPYLRRCLDSVCGQTLRDMEIICVNDGSTDESGEILREYAQRDSRIHLVNVSENRGVAAARNRGIALAKGAYLGFVDSDDYIDSNFYESLYVCARNMHADIAKGEVYHVDIHGDRVKTSQNNAIKHNKIYFTDFFSTAIYHTDIINDNTIIFPAGITQGEDRVFLITAVMVANTVVVVNNVYYWYIHRNDSANTDILDYETIKHGLQSCMLIITNADIFYDSFINKKDYAYIYYSQIETILRWLAPRNNDMMAKKLCAETIMEIYKKCKKIYILETYICNKQLNTLLHYGNISGLVDYIQVYEVGNTKRNIFQQLRNKIVNT